jgi:carbonic anhydrase
LWVGCPDSRVTAIDVPRRDPGDVFVQRNIATLTHTGDTGLLRLLCM